MRISHLIATATLATLAIVPATANAAVKPTCAKDGVCFTKTFNGAKKTITVTGTAGNDKIVVSNKAAFGNNSLSHIAVQGLDTQIDATASVTLVVNALGGDDQISLPVLVQPSGRVLYGSATLDGGAGNDTIFGADRADVLIGGAAATRSTAASATTSCVRRTARSTCSTAGPGPTAPSATPPTRSTASRASPYQRWCT